MFTQPLVIGSTYRLKFKSAFEPHGVCTTPGVTCLHPGGGVFRLEQITNFRDLVLAGIKLYDVFFKPLGISEAKYRKYFDGKPDDEFTPEYTTKTVDNETEEQISSTDSKGDLVVLTRKTITQHEIQVETGRSLLKKHYRDSVDYASYPLYKFVDATDSNDVLWVPELTIDTFPEIDIREYKDLSLVVHLGYTHDPTTLDPMLLSIRERMATYGWRPSLVKLYVTDSKWMSPSEYDGVKKARVPATIETITDETRKEMLGQVAIVNGQLKTIVKPTKINEQFNWLSSVGDPENEVCIEALQKQPVVLDNRLFLMNCEDGETYATGDSYYVQREADSSMFLQAEASDFRDDGEFATGTDYYVFVAVTKKYDKTSDTTRYPEVSAAEKSKNPDPNTVYYVKTTESKFRVAKTDDFNDGKFYTDKSYFTRRETKYYVNKTIRVAFHKLLVEGVDYTPGEPCVEYKLAESGQETLQHYRKQEGGYSVVAYGHHGDYSADVLVRKLDVAGYEQVPDTNTPDESTIYYIWVSENTFREATIDDFKFEETEDTVRDTSKTYYVNDDGYRKCVASDFNDDGSFKEDVTYFEKKFRLDVTYYIYKGSDIVYRAATEEEIADPIQVLYVKQPDKYVATSSTAEGTYVRIFTDKEGVAYSSVLKESYSTLQALSLMGYKFDYEDVFGNSKTMTLQLEDIIESASQTMNVVLPDATFDYDTFWKRFDGRKFRYVNYPNPNDATVTETIDIVISEKTISLLSLKAGMLLGQSGQISKETYVRDTDQQKRNYYMRYVIQSKALADKTQRVAALEQALIEKSASYESQIADLNKQIAELQSKITD